MPLLSPEWSAPDVDEHHQLIKALGQTTCHKTNKVCHRCPINDLCPSSTYDSENPVESNPNY